MEYSGSKYEGSFDSGRFSGDGTYTYPDGIKYVGQFKNVMFHGKGTLIFSNGVYNGVFKNGKEVDGEYVFNDGLKYVKSSWD